jgi:hypothetical protein
LKKTVLLCVLLVVSLVAVAVAVDYYQKVVTVSWRVVEAEGIQVSPEAINLGDIQEGRSASSTFTVKNVSGKTLTVTLSWPVSLCGCGVEVKPSSFILQPGEARVVTVKVTGGLAGHEHAGENALTIFITASFSS